MPGPPPAAPPKKEVAAEQEKKEPLPDDVTQWRSKEHFYQAREEGDPRLIQAVATLGEPFAGKPEADSAAQLLTNLLKKTEQPKPKPGERQQPGGMPPGYPGAPPGMEYPGEAAAPAEGGPPGSMPPGYMPPGAEEGAYPGPYGMPGAGMPAVAQKGVATPELIWAIVAALGANGSKTAKQTLTEVVEGKFETDDNRAATLASLDTLTARLCPEYEELLFRCLTAPEKLRPLGKGGQPGQPGMYPGYGEPGTSAGPVDLMYGGAAGMGPSGRSGGGQLTAEELQREAFRLVAPVASEQFRVRLATHLANPATPREDLALFGDYLRRNDPDNVPAQMVLFAAPDLDAKTKQTIEQNFITFSSDALAGVLGIPVQERKQVRRPKRDQQGYGPEGMYPGGAPEGMYPGGAPPEGYPEPSADGRMRDAAGAGMYPDGATPGDTDASGRPSRYDAAGASGRPSRYAGAQQPGSRPQPPPRKDDPDLPYRLAQHMWAPQMASLVEARLGQIGSLEDENSAPVLLLASTMPLDSTRSALFRLLQQRWKDGPASLESAGLLSDVVSDPALVMLVKLLPRKEPPEEKPARPSLGGLRSGRRQPGGGQPAEGYQEGMQPGAMPGAMPGELEGRPGMAGPGERPGASKTSQEPDAAWMATSEELLRVTCDRLFAAATAGVGTAQAAEKRPLEIRADLPVVAESRVDWPASLPQQLAGVSLGGLRLHYLRCEQTTKISTLEAYFTRQKQEKEQLKQLKLTSRPIHNGLWMDMVGPAPEAGWKRSIDLMFTATVPAMEEFDKKKEQPVTLDILCIDIKDPAAAGAGN